MDNKKVVNVSDINKKRSSLKNNIHSEEMKRLFDKKNIHFDLDPINEKLDEDVSTLILLLLYCRKSINLQLRTKNSLLKITKKIEKTQKWMKINSMLSEDSR